MKFVSGIPRGFTLIEMVVSLAIVAVLMLAMGSVMLLAGKAIPAAGGTMVGATQASEIADRLASELEGAQRIITDTPTSIVFTVADRDGDGVSERIGYAWSGKAGDPLVRTYNGHAATVLESVGRFQLTYDTASVTETYPGPGVEGAEQLLLDTTNGQSPKSFNVDRSDWVGQSVFPSIPANAVGWRPTRFKLLTEKGSSSAWHIMVSLNAADANLKPTTLLAQQTLGGFNLLSLFYSWVTFSFSNLALLAPDQGVCALVTTKSSWNSANLAYDDNLGSGLLSSRGGSSGDGDPGDGDGGGIAGGSWQYDSGKSLTCQVYGTVTMPGPAQTAVRRYLGKVRVLLQRAGTDQPAAASGAALLNQPELDACAAHLDFTGDPTTVDEDADGAADWKTSDGSAFDTSTLASGVWQPGGAASLVTQPTEAFTGLTTAAATMRDATPGGSGAAISMTADVSGGKSAVLYASLTGLDDGHQAVALSAMDSSGSYQPLIYRTGISGGFVAVRLVVDPANQTVALWAGDKAIGTFTYPRFSNSGTGSIAVGTEGDSGAQFQNVSVREVSP